MLFILLLASSTFASPDGLDAASSLLSNQSFSHDDVNGASEVVQSENSDPSTSPTTPRPAFGEQSDDDEQGVKEVWGEWTVATPCTNDCGACGRIHLYRDCLCAGEDGCPCSESETRVEVCATALCNFPRKTCCEGFQKTWTFQGFRCAARDEHSERICEGQWTAWTPDSSNNTCSSPCGMCGRKRIATRKCEPEGCECSGNEKVLYEPCKAVPCPNGRPCCDGFVKGSQNGVEQCVEKSFLHSLHPAARKFIEAKRETETKELLKRKAHLTPVLAALNSPSSCKWGAWVDVDSECSEKCGMCGVKIGARRSCEPIGCTCSGPSVRYEDCGEGICARQDKPCCGAYTNSTVSGVPTCIDAVADVIEKRPARRSHETISTTPRKSHILHLIKSIFDKDLSTSTCRGIWSPFSPSSISSCDGSCGLCGHRVVAERRCIPEGCQCDGSNKLHERCGEKPCWALQNSCCPGASIVLVDGKRICKEDN